MVFLSIIHMLLAWKTRSPHLPVLPENLGAGRPMQLVEKMSVMGYYFFSWLFLTKFAKDWIKWHRNEDICLYWTCKRLLVAMEVLFYWLEKLLFIELVWANRFFHLGTVFCNYYFNYYQQNQSNTATIQTLSSQLEYKSSEVLANLDTLLTLSGVGLPPLT